MPATKYSFPQPLNADEDSRVGRSLMMAKLLFDMNYDIYGNELMQRVEDSRLFRAEFERMLEKPFTPLSEHESPERDFAWGVLFIAALCYTAGRLESSMPDWVLTAEY